MLVLTRKAGEKILIGGNITITQVSCDVGRVRIGIDVPPEVSVMRAELLKRQKENLDHVYPSADNCQYIPNTCVCAT
jgi:carbon storage regulator